MMGLLWVVSDGYNSIAEMSSHGVAPLKEVLYVLYRRVRIWNMVSCGFLNTLEESLKEGKVTEEQINAACRPCIGSKI